MLSEKGKREPTGNNTESTSPKTGAHSLSLFQCDPSSNVTVEKKKPTKKRKRGEDGNYSKNYQKNLNKKRRKQTESSSLIHMRADCTPLVTSFLVDVATLKFNKLNLSEAQHSINSKFNLNMESLAISTTPPSSPVKESRYSPIKTILEYRPTGTPIKCKTRRGTLVYLQDSGVRSNILNFISEEPNTHSNSVIKSNSQEINASFYNSTAFHAIIKPTSLCNVKQQSLTVDKKLLAKTEKEIKNNLGRRIASQAQVMAEKKSLSKHASATIYSKETNLFADNMKFEWLHLIAHSIYGNNAQVDSNLIAGTTHANTAMLITVESLLSLLAKHYPNYQLAVKASTIEGTHIGIDIHYKIITNNFELDFVFNAQNNVKPHVSMHTHIKAIIEALVELNLEDKNNPEKGNKDKFIEQYQHKEYELSMFPFFFKHSTSQKGPFIKEEAMAETDLVGNAPSMLHRP